MKNSKKIVVSILFLILMSCGGGGSSDGNTNSIPSVPNQTNDPFVWETVNPEDVGLKASSIDLTARSGRAALKHRLKLLGFSFSKVELETIYIKFIEMADEKKLLHDEDLYELMKKYN